MIHGEFSVSKPLLRALQGEVVFPRPLWFMRQAGRYLPEYRALRQKTKGFLEMVFTPEVAAEITLQPLRRFNLQAAILFSDILVIPYALGQSLQFIENKGPQLLPFFDHPFPLQKEQAQQKLEPIYTTIRYVKAGLPPQATLIGFAGAPWTVACYMIEGEGSKDFGKVKTFTFSHPEKVQELIDILVETTIEYLKGQIEAGVEAIQLFDSWAGILPPAFLQQWVFEPTKSIFQALRQQYPHIPLIGFPRGIGDSYRFFAQITQPQGISLDTTIDPVWAKTHIPCTLQGNIDPYLIVSGGKPLLTAADNILTSLQDRPFIFNAGHGLVPQTPVAHLEQLIDHIHSFTPNLL